MSDKYPEWILVATYRTALTFMTITVTILHPALHPGLKYQ